MIIQRKICFFTSTRADYYLLKPLLSKAKLDTVIDSRLIVTGTHLLENFGYTVDLIKEDGFDVDFQIFLSTDKQDSTAVIVSSMGESLIQYSDLFSRYRPDLVVILGDRYESLVFAYACHLFRIPIAHIHGGELSYGSFDDSSRHAISKLSFLHFPIAEVYKKRIVQMGEEANRVFNVGALAVENILTTKAMSNKEISQRLNLELEGKYFLITFHPETSEITDPLNQVKEITRALSAFPDYKVIWTSANADPQGIMINNYLESIDAPNISLVKNLGDLYLPVLRNSSLVIGNSSSGIIEAPILAVATVNLGSRQDGRYRTTSIFDSKIQSDTIISNINVALQFSYDSVDHPYGNGNSSEKILDIIKNFDLTSNKKVFFDLELL
jgi:UDP-hydrolysing UDP-N-acetyl-D-glucosamine 2-epimerase